MYLAYSYCQGPLETEKHWRQYQEKKVRAGRMGEEGMRMREEGIRMREETSSSRLC